MIERQCDFLAVDDYGTGGIWFILIAESEDEIHSVLPRVRVFPPGERPDWMSDEIYQEIDQRRKFNIRSLPQSDWMNRLREGR